MADDNTADKDVPNLAPSSLPRDVAMAVLKQSAAANGNQTSGKPSVMKIDQVFSATHLPEDAPKTILFTDSVVEKGSTCDFRESGVHITFSPKAVPEVKLITCYLWSPSAVSLPLDVDESLVSSVIQLACDDQVGVNFTGIKVALLHSATDLGGYELVMKELTDLENNTWKNLNTSDVYWDSAGPLRENCEWQSDLRFVQASITSFSLYAVICRLKSYKFSFDASTKSPEFTCEVPNPVSECAEVSVTIPRKSLRKDVELTMKVQEVLNDDYEEKRAFTGPILHISCPVEVKLREPALVKIPVASQQDLQKLQSLSISNVRIYHQSTRDSSQEWVDITEDLRPPAKLEKGTVIFRVNHFSRHAVVLVPFMLEEAVIQLPKCDFSVPQRAGFLACLCSTDNSVDHLLVLCCFPRQMENIVWQNVSSRYTVVSHGQDTSRHQLNREDNVFFSLPDALSACDEIDMETNFLQFLGHESFQTSFTVRVKKTEKHPQIKFFKRNGREKALCTLVVVPVSQPQIPEMRKDQFLEKLVLNIKDDVGTCWYDLGIALGIKTAVLQGIEQDKPKCRDRAQRVLEIWIEKNGSEATVERLACALNEIGHKSIADKLLALCQSAQPSERAGERSKQPSEREGEQCEQPSEREKEQSKQPSEREVEQSKQPSEVAGGWSKKPSERKGEQPKQPIERPGEQFKQVSERTGEDSKQPSERVGKQSKQLSEPEKEEDIFSLQAEVQELRKVVIGLERQTKEHEGEQAKQSSKRDGEQSKQPSENESGNDMFSLLAEIKELTKIALERKRQGKEYETLKRMIEDTKQMNTQIQKIK